MSPKQQRAVSLFLKENPGVKLTMQDPPFTWEKVKFKSEGEYLFVDMADIVEPYNQYLKENARIRAAERRREKALEEAAWR